MRLSLKALHDQRQIQENQEVVAETKEGLHHRLRNMAFEFYVIYCFMTIDFMDLCTTCFILDI
jgi:hypothetical protein